MLVAVVQANPAHNSFGCPPLYLSLTNHTSMNWCCWRNQQGQYITAALLLIQCDPAFDELSLQSDTVVALQVQTRKPLKTIQKNTSAGTLKAQVKTLLVVYILLDITARRRGWVSKRPNFNLNLNILREFFFFVYLTCRCGCRQSSVFCSERRRTEDSSNVFVGKIAKWKQQKSSLLLINLLPFIHRHRHPSQGGVRPGQGPLQVLRGPRHRHLLRLRQLYAGRVRQEPPGELETQGRCHLLGHITGIQSSDAEGSSGSQMFSSFSSN